MIEGLFSTLKEVGKEVSNSSSEVKPSFFENIPEPENKIYDNEPIQIKSVEEKDSGNSVKLITRNESLEGDIHPITGVAFERMTIEIDDEIIDGVFPKFESKFDAQITDELYEESDYKQFKACNEQLYEAVENNSQLKSKFSKEQLEQIKDGLMDGTSPDGYVWHHDPIPGKIQLVEFDSHNKTGHTGGKTLWGGGTENR